MIGHRLSPSRWLRALILVSLLVILVVAACGTPSGEELVQTKCTRCHTLAIVKVSSKSASEWFNIVYRMKKLGANVDEEQVDPIVQYLATNFGPASPLP
ncbi:MAG: cytochrome c [Anaerolineae bacterium]|jgi:hypothetical protein